jgi:GH25 family lysozyme M1 (1,4-beta-N-acetylmuramidase)
MPVRQTYEPNLNIGAQSGWCLQYVDDAINSLTRSPNAQTAYLNELNAGRINTGHAPVGIWVVGFLGFSRGQYVEDGHVFLMRKREDGSIEIHDSEVHSGARGIYNSIEELMNWMGNYGPDYLGFSYCCDGRRIAEDYDETQPTDRKMEEDGNARDEANTNSAIFQELEKGDVIAMKGYVTNGQSVAGDTVWYVTARSGKYMSRQLFEDKDLHDLPDLTPKNNIQGYQRKAVESGVRARKAPNTSSDVAQIINGNTIIDMKAWCRGESIENNDVWFISKENALYLWSGAFTDTSTHDLPEETVDTPKSQDTPEIDYGKQIIDISNYQNEKVVDIFPKVGGVIVKTGWVGEKFGGNEFKLDPRAKLFTDKAREAGKLLGFYWLPYFSTREEAEQNAEYFVKCIETLGNQAGELLFIDLEPDFEGTAEQIAVFSNIVLQKTGKQVFTYAGESIIKKLGLDRVDWYPNYGTKDNYAHGSLIHQYTESGKIDGFNLDFSTSKISIDELKAMSKPQQPETPEIKPEAKPEIKPEPKPEVKTEKPTKSLLQLIIDFLISLFKK